MNQIADALFLSRAMGAPVPPGKDWAKWTSAALSNAERRAAAVAHIDALLGQLYRVVYEGECPCESGHDFRVCHGADSLADEAQSAQNGAS